MSQITLTKYISDLNAAPPGDQRQGWVLEVTATSEDLDPAVFVYHLGDGLLGDRFEAVASIFQMEELPPEQVDRAVSGSQVPYYRSAELKLLCRSAVDLEFYWQQIVNEVALLVRNINAAQVTMAEQTAVINETTATVANLVGQSSRRVQLSWRPAGLATLSESGVQGITSPNSSLVGWLPVSSVPNGWIVPAGAFLFYNLSQDTALQALWPPTTPFSKHALYRNGLLLPYGLTHVITANTLWWLIFNPDTVPGYIRADGQTQDSNAPWPVDYVSAESPGNTATNLVLQLYP